MFTSWEIDTAFPNENKLCRLLSSTFTYMRWQCLKISSTRRKLDNFAVKYTAGVWGNILLLITGWSLSSLWCVLCNWNLISDICSFCLLKLESISTSAHLDKIDTKNNNWFKLFRPPWKLSHRSKTSLLIWQGVALLSYHHLQYQFSNRSWGNDIVSE